MAALVSLEELTVLFKRQPFHVLNLITIWVNPNDTSSVVDSDIELNSIQFNSIQFLFTMYNGLKCLPVKINYSNLCKFGLVQERFNV